MTPVVHVLLATYNGETFLPQQWASLEAQEGVELVVHVADDGSADKTCSVLRRLAGRRGTAVRDVRWVDAPPRRSATRSFLLLVKEAVEACPDAQWFAYCDQDDIWMPGKLAAAHAMLSPYMGSTTPALYGGRTLAVDEHDREGGLSPLFSRPPSFRNAVAQNIMGGNTMLMNRAAASLVADAAELEVVTHDWLTYQLVSGAGGVVHYDPRAFVRYRQHALNVIGSNLGWRARWHRLLRMLRGEYREWNDLNTAALLQRASVLTRSNLNVLHAFMQARGAVSARSRIRWLRRSGVFRQKLTEHCMLWVACLLRRM